MTLFKKKQVTEAKGDKTSAEKIKDKIIELDNKKGKKIESKEPKELDVKIPEINSFKTNSFAVTTNKLLSKHISPEAGDCYFGENLARTTEYYGLKARPWVALIVSGVIVLVEIVKKLFRKKDNV